MLPSPSPAAPSLCDRPQGTPHGCDVLPCAGFFFLPGQADNQPGVLPFGATVYEVTQNVACFQLTKETRWFLGAKE